MPSPGPMCEMWLKLDGAEISFERRSGLLQILRLDLDSLPVVWLCTICGINHVMFEHPTKDGDEMMQILVFAWSSRASVCNLSVVGLIIIVYFGGNLRN